MKKQVGVYGRYQSIKSEMRTKKLATAHKLWEKEDFDTMKMDKFCSEITASMKSKDAVDLAPCIFRTWEETWEKVVLGPGGDSLLEARVLWKYGGLCWLDDNDFM